MTAFFGFGDDEIRRVEERTRVRHIVAKDKSEVKLPYAIAKIGDEVLFWATSGILSPSTKASIPLTLNREPRGESAFERIPTITLYELVSSNQPIGRSTGPLKPSLDFRICPPNNATWELKWIGSDERWEVAITNNDTVKRDFVIIARGV